MTHNNNNKKMGDDMQNIGRMVKGISVVGMWSIIRLEKHNRETGTDAGEESYRLWNTKCVKCRLSFYQTCFLRVVIDEQKVVDVNNLD